MIHYYRYLFVKMKVFNYSELHISEVTSFKIHTLVETDIYLIVLEPATGRNQADYPAKKYEYQCPFRTGLK